MIIRAYHMWVCLYTNNVIIQKNREDIWLLHIDFLCYLTSCKHKICGLGKDFFFGFVQKVWYDSE